mmetsp:Transcript_21374/g.58804  ORF Transcript_21374/g.58804 Transcript_21374/m.58804 type:complete len:257 (+) Transcript_21374:682-1452(+)
MSAHPDGQAPRVLPGRSHALNCTIPPRGFIAHRLVSLLNQSVWATRLTLPRHRWWWRAQRSSTGCRMVPSAARRLCFASQRCTWDRTSVVRGTSTITLKLEHSASAQTRIPKNPEQHDIPMRCAWSLGQRLSFAHAMPRQGESAGSSIRSRYSPTSFGSACCDANCKITSLHPQRGSLDPMASITVSKFSSRAGINLRSYFAPITLIAVTARRTCPGAITPLLAALPPSTRSTTLTPLPTSISSKAMPSGFGKATS